jgi:hypothetical protein
VLSDDLNGENFDIISGPSGNNEEAVYVMCVALASARGRCELRGPAAWDSSVITAGDDTILALGTVDPTPTA